MSQITKILFRQGTNLIRKLQNVILDLGEPGYTVDTKRVYIGDGITIGGVPVGVKNWGTYNPVFSSISPRKYDSSVSTIISAVEAGDIIYDSQNLTLFYATTSTPTESQWQQYSFAGLTLSGYNGINISSQNGTLSAQLDPTHFSINPSNQSIAISYHLITSLNNNIYSGGNITATGIVSANTSNSNQWANATTVVNTNSAIWGSLYTNVNTNSSTWSTGTSYYYRAYLGYNSITTKLSSFNPSSPLPPGVSNRVYGYELSLQGDTNFQLGESIGGSTSLLQATVNNSSSVVVNTPIYTRTSARVYVNGFLLSSFSGPSNTTLMLYISTTGNNTISFVTAADGSPGPTLMLGPIWTNSVKFISAGP